MIEVLNDGRIGGSDLFGRHQCAISERPKRVVLPVEDPSVEALGCGDNRHIKPIDSRARDKRSNFSRPVYPGFFKNLAGTEVWDAH